MIYKNEKIHWLTAIMTLAARDPKVRMILFAGYIDDAVLVKDDSKFNACSYFLYSKPRPGVYSSIDLCVLDSQPKMNFMENKALTQLESLAKAFESSSVYYDEFNLFVDSWIESELFGKAEERL